MTHLTYFYRTYIYPTRLLVRLFNHFHFVNRDRVPESHVFGVAGQGPSMVFKTLGPNGEPSNDLLRAGLADTNGMGQGVALPISGWAILEEKLVSTAKGPLH